METKRKIDIRLITLIIMTSLLGLWRLLGTSSDNTVWNFTPIGAMALFAGTYFVSRYKSYLFPLVVLFVSDVILMQGVHAEYSSGLLYSGWAWTYGSFLVMVWIGRMNRKKTTVVSFLLGSFLTAFAHYLITDLGVWLAGGRDMTTGMPYPKNMEGFMRCYILAIPYFKNVLLGNLFFGSILFGGFEWAQWQFPILRIKSSVAKINS